VVVAVGDQPGGDALIRAAKRFADAMRASWTAVSVETPRTATLSEAARNRMAASLKLATGLGAAIATVPAASVVEGLRAHILESRATAVVIGKTRRSWWFQLRHGSVVDHLVRELDNIAVHVVPIGLAPGPEGGSASRRPSALRGIVAGLGMVAMTTAGAVALRPIVGANSIDIIYLLPVIAAATLFGLRASLVASLAAALAYNFFFLPPIYTFTISDPQNVVTLLVLIVVAVVASQLTGRLKRQATIGARTATENAALAAFGQRLASVSDETGTAAAVCEEVAKLLDVSTILLAREQAGVVPVGACPPGALLGTLDMAAAEWSFDRGEVAGRDSGTLTSSDWQFHPLETALGVLGVLGIAPHGNADPLAADKRILFTTLLGQAALAHERLKLEANAREVSALKQRDGLRATLLSSIGHDLKTPLTAVVAAADALAAEHGESSTTATLKSEARRLRRVFDDLVEMTRIETGALIVKREATDLTDAIASAAHDLRAELVRHPLVLDVPPTLPLVEADPRMLHHILINLLGNAAKFSSPGSSITVEARRLPDRLVLSVLDQGPGLPPGREATLFDRFTRVDGNDMSGGTGLGLAIVKGFADAMGLTVSAANREAGGATFGVIWPEPAIRRMAE
jgi:two-component system sensor histidine kinase KdpD